jgi:hypothetical protein
MDGSKTEGGIMDRAKDITGQKFNRLTAVERAGNSAKGLALWLFRCECGGTKISTGAEVRRGGVKSCGCAAIEQKINAGKSRCHAFSRANFPRERKSWENMIDRCTNPDNNQFHNYGGRGISVCDRWKQSFKNFLEDMGARPANTSIDRIDNSFDYCPENCRWADAKTQNRNRSNNHVVVINGEAKTLSQWAERYKVPQSMIGNRIYRGWPEHAAITLPKGSRKP